jgi:hypothetical protein
MAAVSKLGRWRIGYGGTACPRCKAPLRPEDLRTGTQFCPQCAGPFEAVRFDPVKPVVAVPALAGVGPTTSAPCARHVRNQAVASCGRCGQFMCSLCRIDAEGNAYCPPCFDRLSAEGAIPGGAMQFTNYAGLARFCLVCSYSMFFSFFAPITSPLGIFFSVKGIQDKKRRNEEDGIVGLYVVLLFNVLGILIGLLMIAGALGAFRDHR